MASKQDEVALATVNEALAALVEQARAALGDDLLAVVLFGSAAEERLRPVSDVNLMVVLQRFEPARIDLLRPALRTAHAAIRAKVMFMLRDELSEAASLFAVKFNDMKARHRVLFGSDPLADLVIDPSALRRRLREVLMDLSLRLRERYTALSLRDEQLAPVIAEAAAPLRAAALAWLALRGQAGSLTPREALIRVVEQAGDAGFVAALDCIPQARAAQRLAPGEAGPAVLQLSRLAGFLRVQLDERSAG